MKTKKCTKCGIEKPLTEFSKDNGRKDGRRSHCKTCMAQYRTQNKERIAERQAQWYDRNKERMAEYKRRYYAENREKKAEYNNRYYDKNKEKIAEQHAQYRAQNKEKIASYQKRWGAENKERIAEQKAQYYVEKITEQPSCTYQIKNLVNNKVYIGETVRGEIRWKQHLSRLRGGYHPNKLLQEDFNKHGEEAFEWTILEEFESDDKDALLLEEARAIQRYIQDGVELYNLMLTVEQLKMLEEDKKSQ